MMVCPVLSAGRAPIEAIGPCRFHHSTDPSRPPDVAPSTKGSPHARRLPVSPEMYTSCWQIVAFSVASALVQEVVNYFLIYRTSSYRGVKDSIERASKRLEGIRANASGTKEKQMKKKEKNMDSVMKSAQQDMALIKMKSTLVIGVLLFASYKVLSSYFDGAVVGKIPFEPYAMFRSLTHRGLEGEDWTDCSMAAIYALCASSIRFNLTKLIGDNMGWSAPRSMNGTNPFLEGLDKEK